MKHTTVHIFFLLTVTLMPGRLLSQSKDGETSLKAAFIYNFTRYIDWDESNTETYFIIGIIGSSPIIEPLTQIARSGMVGNKKIIIRSFNTVEEIGFCNILFIPGQIPFPLESILAKTGKGELTISEEPGYAERGTSLNFILVNNKLKFEANLKSIYAANLKASSQLLKLAIIVD